MDYSHRTIYAPSPKDMASLSALYASAFAAHLSGNDATTRAAVREAMRAERASACAPVQSHLTLGNIPVSGPDVLRPRVPQHAIAGALAVFGTLYVTEKESDDDAGNTRLRATRSVTDPGYAIGWGKVLVDSMRISRAPSAFATEPAPSVRTKTTIPPPLVILHPRTTVDVEKVVGVMRDEAAGRPAAKNLVDPARYERARAELERTAGPGVARALDEMRLAADAETRVHNKMVTGLFDMLESPEMNATEQVRATARNAVAGMEKAMEHIGVSTTARGGRGVAGALGWATMSTMLGTAVNDAVNAAARSEAAPGDDTDGPFIVASGMQQLVSDVLFGTINARKTARRVRFMWRRKAQAHPGVIRDFITRGTAPDARADTVRFAMESHLAAIDKIARSEMRAGRIRETDRVQINALVNDIMTRLVGAYEEGTLEVDADAPEIPPLRTRVGVGARRRGRQASPVGSDDEEFEEVTDDAAGEAARSWKDSGSVLTLLGMLAIAVAMIAGAFFGHESAAPAPMGAEAIVNASAFAPGTATRMDAFTNWSSPIVAERFHQSIAHLRELAVEFNALDADGNVAPVKLAEMLHTQIGIQAVEISRIEKDINKELASLRDLAPKQNMITESLANQAKASAALRKAIGVYDERAAALEAIASGDGNGDGTVARVEGEDPLVSENRARFVKHMLRIASGVADFINVDSDLATQFQVAAGGGMIGKASPLRIYGDLIHTIIVDGQSDAADAAEDVDALRFAIVQTLEDQEAFTFDDSDPTWRAWLDRAARELVIARRMYASIPGLAESFNAEVAALEEQQVSAVRLQALAAGDTTHLNVEMFEQISSRLFTSIQEEIDDLTSLTRKRVSMSLALRSVETLYGTNPTAGALPWHPGGIGEDMVARTLERAATSMLGEGGTRDQCAELLFYRADVPYTDLGGERVGAADSAHAFVRKWMTSGSTNASWPTYVLGQVGYRILGGAMFDASANAVTDASLAVRTLLAHSAPEDVRIVIGEIVAGLGRVATTLVIYQQTVSAWRALALIGRGASRTVLAERTIEQMTQAMQRSGAASSLIYGRVAAAHAARGMQKFFTATAASAELVGLRGRSIMGTPAVALLLGLVHVSTGILRMAKGSFEQVQTAQTGLSTIGYVSLGTPMVMSAAAMLFGGRYMMRSVVGIISAMGAAKRGRRVAVDNYVMGLSVALAHAHTAVTFIPNSGRLMVGAWFFGRRYITDPDYRERMNGQMRTEGWVDKTAGTAIGILATQVFGEIANVIAAEAFGMAVASATSFLSSQPSHGSDVAAITREHIAKIRASGSASSVAEADAAARAGRVPLTLRELGDAGAFAHASGAHIELGAARRTLRPLEDARASIGAAQAARCDAIVAAGGTLFSFETEASAKRILGTKSWNNYLELLHTRKEWQVRITELQEEIRSGAVSSERIASSRALADASRRYMLDNVKPAVLP